MKALASGRGHQRRNSIKLHLAHQQKLCTLKRVALLFWYSVFSCTFSPTRLLVYSSYSCRLRHYFLFLQAICSVRHVPETKVNVNNYLLWIDGSSEVPPEQNCLPLRILRTVTLKMNTTTRTATSHCFYVWTI